MSVPILTGQLQHGKNIKQVDYDLLMIFYYVSFFILYNIGGLIKAHETISGGLRNHPSALAVWS
jgi:hypothetical protein